MRDSLTPHRGADAGMADSVHSYEHASRPYFVLTYLCQAAYSHAASKRKGDQGMTAQSEATDLATNGTQDAARIALGLMLVVAGTSHLTVAREAFKAQFLPGCRSTRTRSCLNQVWSRSPSERLSSLSRSIKLFSDASRAHSSHASFRGTLLNTGSGAMHSGWIQTESALPDSSSNRFSSRGLYGRRAFCAAVAPALLQSSRMCSPRIERMSQTPHSWQLKRLSGPERFVRNCQSNEPPVAGNTPGARPLSRLNRL